MKVKIRRIRKLYEGLFQDVRRFPSHESEPDRLGLSAFPVVRVRSRFPGLRSKHVIKALRAFLLHPVKLPPDTGAGPCSVTARLEPSAIAGAMRLAGEKNRAAMIRRLIGWKFYSAESSPVPVPVGATANKPVTAQAQPSVAPNASVFPFGASAPYRENAPAKFDLLLPIAQNTLIAHGAGHLFDPADRYEMSGGFLVSKRRGKLCAL
ncbi:MAG: hypothetical protein ACYDD2_13070 [Candidatus Acidiferrales bacterium]